MTDQILTALLGIIQVNVSLSGDGIAIKHVDIYGSDADLESRLNASKLPALAIMDDGDIWEPSDISNMIRHIYRVRLRLIHQSISREHLQFDSRSGVYPLILQLRIMLKKYKHLVDPCSVYEAWIVDGMLERYERRPILWIGSAFQASGHDLFISYYKDENWTRSDNDQT